MSPHDEHAAAPDIERLVRSMLVLHGAHDSADSDDSHGEPPRRRPTRGRGSSSSRVAASESDPRRAAALGEATRRDRERYLGSGLQSVDCRFCHVSVLVKRLGPGHTSVQWNSDAARRCAHFADVRESGGDPARERGCPRLADSIDHAVAEGVLEPVSTAPRPGDG